MIPRFRPVALLAMSLLLAACAASTTLSDVWVAEGVKAGDYRKVLVIAVTPNPDRRMGMEEALSKRIAGSVPSHRLMPLAELTDRPKVQARLLSDGFDGALVVRLLAVETTQSEMSGHASMLNPNAGLYGYWDPAAAAWDRDHVVTTREVTMEVAFFDARSAERKFLARSHSYDPADQDALIGDLMDALRAELKQRGVL